MIRYRLNCAKDHEFEAWFKSSGDFDKQAKRGLVACPQCGSARVSKALMAPQVKKSAEKARKSPLRKEAKQPASSEPSASNAVAGMPTEFVELVRKLRDEVTKNADFVGDRFAEEARKIHHEEAPARGIYGKASLAEVKELIDEGIECAPLPELPEDKN